MKKHASEEAFYQRLKELAEVNKPVLKDNTRNLGTLIDYKRAADGIAYGIIKEQHHYYIKKAGIKQDPNVADFAYIGGLSNITEYQYSKLAEADKQRNMIFGTINEAVSHKPSLTGSKKKRLNEDKAGREIDNAESKLGDLDAATSAETTPETPGAPLDAPAEPSTPDAVSSEPATDTEVPPTDNAEPVPAGGEETDVTTGDETPAGEETGEENPEGETPAGEENPEGETPAGEENPEGETPAGDEEVQKMIGKLTNKIRKTEMEDPEIKGELKSLISAYKDKLKKMDIEDRKEIADGILKVVGDDEIADLGNSVEQDKPEGLNPEGGIEEDQCAECGGFGKYAESRGYSSPEKFMECDSEEQANVVNGYVGAQEDGMNDGDEKTISLVIKLSPDVLDKLKTDYGRDDYAEKIQPQVDSMNESEEDTMAQLNELWGGLGALGKAAGQGIRKGVGAVGSAIGGAAKGAGQAIGGAAKGAYNAVGNAANSIKTGVQNAATNIKKTYNQGEINPEVSKLEGVAADLGKQIAALNKRMVGAGQQPVNVKSILATIQNQLGAGGQANLGKLRTAEGVVDPANVEVQPNVLKEEDETDEPEIEKTGEETPEETPEVPEETPEVPEETPETPEETPFEVDKETPEETPEVNFFGKDSQSLGGGVVKPDGAPTTAVDVTIEPDKTIQITMNEAKRKLIKQIAEGVNAYMSEISPIKKLEPVKSLPPVMNENEIKLRKYIRTRLEEKAGLRKANLNESKKSTTLKKLDEVIDKQFKLFESVVLKKKDKLK